ncbi:MAG: NAD(P)-binding domain-containing protein [Bacteroidales bacterium]|nr:NAD(P)-binding domain-containing protein [Bacteroidales bacterium]
MKTKSIGFIGGGRITRIMLQVIENNKTEYQAIVVYDINPMVLADLKEQFPGIKVADSNLEPAQQDLIFISLHPPVIMETLELVKEQIKPGAVVISLAPKITIAKIASKLPDIKNIVRLIPNATSIVNEGYNPVCFAEGMSEWKKQPMLTIFRRMGHTFEVSENKLESYAIMSAMLPTYFWFQWKELVEIGCKIGLTEEESYNSVRDTMLAAWRTYYYSGLTPDEVINLVPVKPIGESEAQIRAIYNDKLIPLFEKIKPGLY